MAYKQNLLRGGARGLERRDHGGEPNTPSMSEIRNLIDGLQRTFGEFRSQNDTRLRQIEQRGSSDVITAEQVDRINTDLGRLQTELTEMQTRANRPAAAGAGDAAQTPQQAEYRRVWNEWARRGLHTDHQMLEMERRANTTQTPQDGGVLVPVNIDRNIIDISVEQSQIRNLFGSFQISGANYSRLVGLHGTQGGWVAETDLRPATAGPQFTTTSGVFGELYANPQVSQTLLDDSLVDLEAYLADDIATTFINMEGGAYTWGDGVKKPKGLFVQPSSTDVDGVRPYGTFQTVYTGNGTGLQANAAASDNLIDIATLLKPAYRNNATWVMNRLTQAQIRKLKDGQGNYLWQASITAGQPSTLLSYPVADIEEMQPLGTAGNIPIAFGDFKRAYSIIDVIGIRTLRDPYTNKPYVGFYTTKRVGGVPLDSQAVKFVKIGTGS